MTTIDEQLVKYLADAHSIEEQALQQLKGAPKASGDSGLADIFRDHLTETEGHERAIRARLEAHGEGANKLKDLLMKVGGTGFLLFARAQPDTPGKLAAFAFAFEHLEIAAYEELKRVAQRVEDTDTVRVADEILTQERAAAATLASSFDRAAAAALEAVGVS